MTTGDALRRAILAEPDDDTARLVYADWLDEHGEGDRAAFIRAQIEVAREEPFGRKARAAEAIAKDLRGENWKEWTATIRDQVLDLRFERGFIAHVDMETGAFHRNGREVFAEHPIQSLRLVPHTNPEYRTELAPVFGLSCLARLKRLAFAPQTDFLYDDHEAIAGSEHLAGITDLAIAGNAIFPPWLTELLRGEKFPALVGLDVADVSHLGPALAAALARADHRGFRRLDLSRIRFTSDQLLQILHSRCLRSVEELQLGWSPLRPDDTGPLFHINIGWVIPWDRLVVLDLGGQRLGDEGVKELVGKPEVGALRWLGLSDNRLTREGVRMLTGSKFLKLNHLDIRGNTLTPSLIVELKDRFPDAVVLG